MTVACDDHSQKKMKLYRMTVSMSPKKKNMEDAV